MGNIEFAWDRREARSNLAKHGVAFEEARIAFLDENARVIDDPDHSNGEERCVLVGYSSQARCLVGVHCYREADSIIRLISARCATPSEEELYWSFR